MIHIREAQESDISQIRDVYMDVYGKDYPYQQFYDEQWLKRTVFSDDILMLVAEDSNTKKILGTASVIYDIGAYSDLVGEFGRLAVREEDRHLGVGALLMKKRVESIQDRLHLGLIESRVVHDFAQKIAHEHRFVPVGFQPLKHYFFGRRESLALLVRYFGDALLLRKNNPRMIPEACPLAHLAMNNASITDDAIADEESTSYPHNSGYQLKELTAEGLPSLLRIERGRVRHREIFGHMRLEYGFFKLRVGRATYLIACDENQIAGAIGFTLDNIEHTVRVFELITFTEQSIWFLLSELERKCQKEWGVEYIQIDVSAHAPRMQRTLLELNFLPCGYIPAMVFHEVERLDIIRMVRLIKHQDLGPIKLIPQVKSIADLVMRGFSSQKVAPRIAQVASEMPLFKGLAADQLARLASACTVMEVESGKRVFVEKDPADKLYIVLQGHVGIFIGQPAVRIGTVRKGETLGELSLLTSGPHSATAVAESRVEAATLTHQDLSELVRLRPDIGLALYRNLAVGLGSKLMRSDLSLQNLLSGGPRTPKRQGPQTLRHDSRPDESSTS
jgi:predicted N-acetyltransferase YhbS